MVEKVTIPIDLYRGMVRDSFTLQAYLEAGVDNWEGCEFVDWPTDEEVENEVVKATEQYKRESEDAEAFYDGF